MKLKDLSPNERNPRKITPEKKEMLRKSLDEFGDLSSIVFNRRNQKLVGGHQRGDVLPPDAEIVITQEYSPPTRTGTVAEGHIVIAGEKYKYREVDWDNTKANAAMISANKQGGEWDFPALNDLMLELDHLNFDMDLTGFNAAEIEKQMTYVSAHERELPGQSEEEKKESSEQKEQRIARIVIPEIIEGDCLEVLKTLSDNSIDALVTDPPYGWRFMGKAWDVFDIEKRRQEEFNRPPRKDGKSRGQGDPSLCAGLYDQCLKGNIAFQEWTRQWAIEVFRVLKPGAHLLIFCGPRTYHRMASGVEDAGFEVRDQLQWLFGSGFPKSLAIDKAIDKINGDERPVHGMVKRNDKRNGNFHGAAEARPPIDYSITSAASAAWEGWGTGLKPANEPILLARKPIEDGLNIAENCLKWGVGGLNIDASRIRTTEDTSRITNAGMRGNNFNGGITKKGPLGGGHSSGRFPANLVLSHNPDCELLSGGSRGGSETAGWQDKYVGGKVQKGVQRMGYESEVSEQWQCTPGCAVAGLDEQSGTLKSNPGTYRRDKRDGDGNTYRFEGQGVTSLGDAGGASRFFYCAKTSKRERNEGLNKISNKMVHRFGEGIGEGIGEGLHPEAPTVEKNSHPTVKPIRLMSYLINMITPPGGTVLDPFTGSGSTGVAAGRLGFKFIGIEKDPEYVQIARHRFVHEMQMNDDEITETEGEEPENSD